VARDGCALLRIEAPIQKTCQCFFIRTRIERGPIEGEAGSRHVRTFSYRRPGPEIFARGLPYQRFRASADADDAACGASGSSAVFVNGLASFTARLNLPLNATAVW
jgi:hypothetical protein